MAESRTAIGHELSKHIGSPLAALLYQFAGALKKHPAWKHKWRIIITAIVSLVVVKKLKEKAAAPPKAAASATAAAAPAAKAAAKPAEPAAPPKPTPPAPPSVKDILTDGKGYVTIEGVAAAGLTALAGWLMIKRSWLYGRIIHLQQTKGSWTAYTQVLWQYPVVCVFIAALLEGAEHCKRLVELKWRRNATKKLHDLYFSQMGYYKLQNGHGGAAIPDPDTRIVHDIGAMAKAQASIVFSVSSASVFTVLMGGFAVQGRSLLWGFSAPLSFFLALMNLRPCFGPAMFMAGGYLAHFEGLYSKLLTRAQLHAERIFMLQGEGFEAQGWRKCLDEGIVAWKNKFKDATFMKDVTEGMWWGGLYPNFMECLGNFIAASMGCNDVIAGFVKARALQQLPLDPDVPQAFTSAVLGRHLQDMQAFFNTLRGWGIFVTTYFGLQESKVCYDRVQAMFAQLQQMQSETATEHDVFTDDGKVIAFNDVTIRTPADRTLLKHLSFRVEEGQMLLICGHNGAGKSSIIRSLSALWSIPEGKISRPGGKVQAEEEAQLHDEIYYLPQKPANVLGSLSDQLTYPIAVEGGLPDVELRRWLRYVDLEYLADRNISPDDASKVGENMVDWDLQLSLGEQQALSIARLLYHCPRFAILDECTSAIGKSLERRLFELTKELGISCITITHRPALKEHHDKMLQLTGRKAGDDDPSNGWTLTDLDHEKATQPIRSRPKTQQEAAERIEALLPRTRKMTGGKIEEKGEGGTEHELLERRSEEYTKLAAKETRRSAAAAVRERWPSAFARNLSLVKLGLTTQEQKTQALKRCAMMAGLVTVHTRCVWTLWRGQVGMMIGAMCGDRRRIFAEFIANVSTTFFIGGVCQMFKQKAYELTRDLWANASKELHRRAVKDGAFVKVTNPLDNSTLSIENPIQRLTELKSFFGLMEAQLSSVVLTLVPAICWLPTGIRGVGMWTPLLLVFNYVAFRGSSLLAPDFAKTQAEDTMLEGRFQFLHTRLRTIAEPVAFSGGGSAERRIIEPHLEALLAHRKESLTKEYFYNTVVNFFTEYMSIPVWTQRLISLNFVRQNNPPNTESFSPTLIMSDFLFDRTTQYPQIAVQRLVMFAPEWQRMDGCASRVLELVCALESVSDSGPLFDGGKKDSVKGLADGSQKIHVNDLDVVTKAGSCLVRGLNFDAEKGKPMLITGPNATGKSLFGNVLLGLWPARGAGNSVTVPGAVGRRPPLQTVVPAPQRIYLPAGRLLDALCYPKFLVDSDLQPPFRLSVRGSGMTSVIAESVRAKLQERGASDINTDNDASAVHATFPTAESLLEALAKPTFWNIDGVQLDADFWRETSTEGQSPIAGTSPLPYMPRMLRALQATGIQHVLDREEKGWLAQQTWEDILSGGEQQRLCMARVLYHGPNFGLLDECTSMVAADAEEDLYKKLFKEWGITPITLTQRMFMPDLYVKELEFGATNANGWEMLDCKA